MSKSILEDALDDYEGTLIAVSHDRYFINRIADYIYVMEDGKITKYIGNYDNYVEKISENNDEDTDNQQVMTKTAIQKQQKKDKELARQQKEAKNKLKNLEKQIEELEKRKSELEGMLADENIYKNSEKSKQINMEHEEVIKQLDKVSEEWLILSEE